MQAWFKRIFRAGRACLSQRSATELQMQDIKSRWGEAHLQVSLHLVIQLFQQCITVAGRHGSRLRQSFTPLLPWCLRDGSNRNTQSPQTGLSKELPEDTLTCYLPGCTLLSEWAFTQHWRVNREKKSCIYSPICLIRTKPQITGLNLSFSVFF